MINVKQWMDLPIEVRAKIIHDFNLVRTGRAGVANNKIVSDGYTQDDISKINLLNLQKVLDSAEEDFDSMFKDYVDMIQKTLAAIEEPEFNIEVDMSSIEPVNNITNSDVDAIVKQISEQESEVYNPNIAASGDTETYFGTKIKPITYKPNVKKETNKRK